MPEITNPRELFLHELGDILYVERQLVSETLPKLIGEVQDKEFKNGLKAHLKQTRGHVKNVQMAFKAMGEKPHAEECIAFEGIKREHDEMVSETAPELIDLVDLGATARSEAYEVAAYESLKRMARGLGEREVVKLLDQNLKEDKQTLREIEKLATRINNESAAEPAAA
jgi:ferritin-like metal-binding protein YciE